MKPLRFLKQNSSLLWLFYPVFVLTIIGYWKIPILLDYIKETIALGVFTTTLLCVLLFFNNKNHRRFLFILFYIILSLVCFIKLSFYHLFGVKISASALYVAFESNTNEMSEFFQMYFSAFSVFLLVLFILPLIKFRKNIRFTFKANLFLKVGLISILLFSLFLSNKYFKSYNFGYVLANSYKDYLHIKEAISQSLAKPESDFIKIIESDTIPQTFVVVIGESTSKKHMQLYGYHRETNPLLEEIKDHLMVFDSVISPDVHTILALDKILTFSTHKEPNKNPNASVVQLSNMAGFTTYWISNQRPVGMHESISTQMATAAKKRFFLATDDYMEVNYDEKILPVLKEILNDSVSKKMIFIHLIGTHGKYKYRFPESFKYFNDTLVSSTNHSEDAIQEINDYDNAVRYNDFIVKNIINLVGYKNENSYVLYFSDHGDEVYDTIDYRGHNSYFATPSMHEVPFIVWFSDTYKQIHPENISPNFSSRRYSLVNFIHSFATLSGIKFNKLDSTKSVFSPYFKKHSRIIKKNIDYDAQKN